MMCVGCVAVLSRGEEKTARAARLRWAITALFGVLIAWLVFYYLGLTLARIPSEFHSQSAELR
jgi:small neutral amino acid transporter SnatA (MarC family)